MLGALRGNNFINVGGTTGGLDVKRVIKRFVLLSLKYINRQRLQGAREEISGGFRALFRVTLCISKASLSPGSGMGMCLILAGKAPFLSWAGTRHSIADIRFVSKPRRHGRWAPNGFNLP